ncbi:MAG TPA: hypothetical protein VEL76_17000 [Gemmataceae bacterium]|nr:hypothetical protein [Gemmataceae bacterium]
MRRVVFALAVVVLPDLLAGAARADVPRPPWVPRPNPYAQRLPQPPVTRLVIETDGRAKETRLLIPRQLLPQLKTAALGGRNGDRQATAGLGFWAMALTLGVALACCGLRLVWPRRAFAAAGLTLVLAAVVLAGGEQAFARPCPAPIPDFTATGQVVVTVVEEGNAVRLVLAKNPTWPTRYER